MAKNLHDHDLNIVDYQNSQCRSYLGSCRIFSIHCIGVFQNDLEIMEFPKLGVPL